MLVGGLICRVAPGQLLLICSLFERAAAAAAATGAAVSNNLQQDISPHFPSLCHFTASGTNTNKSLSQAAAAAAATHVFGRCR